MRSARGRAGGVEVRGDLESGGGRPGERARRERGWGRWGRFLARGVVMVREWLGWGLAGLERGWEGDWGGQSPGEAEPVRGRRRRDLVGRWAERFGG